MTDEDRARLPTRAMPRIHVIGMLACVVLLPLMFAGFIAWPLIWLGISQDIAWPIALGLIFAFGLAMVVKFHVYQRREIVAYDAAVERVKASGVVLTYQFTPTRCWIVDELEDFGPGYVFDVGGEECVYLASEEFLADEFNADFFPGIELTVEVVPEIHQLAKLEIRPGKCPASERCLNFSDLGIEITRSFALIPTKRISSLI